MSHFVKNESTTKDLFIHLYENVENASFHQAVHEVFISSGYELKDGEPANGTYVRGNRTMRILFGAFVKYFKFTVLSETNTAGGVRLSVVRATSGMSGGIVGMNQVKKEAGRLSAVLKNL